MKKGTSIITEEEFLEFYKLGLCDRAIATRLDVSISVIVNMRNKLNLKSNIRQRFELTSLTEDEFQVLIGGLLGDSWLNKPRKITHNIGGGFANCVPQKDYVYYKYEYLKRFCSEPKHYLKPDSRSGKVYENYWVVIKSRSIFNEIYKNWYTPKKIVFKEDLWKLTGLGLAIWYMDDGMRHSKSYKISTCAFDKESIRIIQEFFLEKYNIETTVHSDNSIYIRMRSRQIFYNLVKDYIHPCMEYKVKYHN